MHASVLQLVADTLYGLLVVLQVIEGRDQVDWKRHGVFVTFGFFYLVSLETSANKGLGLPASS